MPDQGPHPARHADPLPSPRHSMLVRFRQTMKWIALLSVVVAAIAVLLVARGDTGVHLHMMVAAALGAGLTVLLATALMTLVFLSSSSGDAGHSMRTSDKDEDRP